MSFQVGVRTVPAGSLQFVDFSKPDPGAERVERFMTAAQHALAEGNPALAAQRLIYARDADPTNPAVLRLLTVAFWQSGNLPAAGRAVRDWGRAETDRPTAERYASRIYEDMGAIDLATDAAERVTGRVPEDASAWARLGVCGCDCAARRRDRGARARAADRASVEILLDLALAQHLAGDVGAEVSAAEAATIIAPDSPQAWSAFAHALARTDRLQECIAACERALRLGDDPEVRELLERTKAALPHELSSAPPPDQDAGAGYWNRFLTACDATPASVMHLASV